MAFFYNPVPALTQEGLVFLDNLVDQTRRLKLELYGPDSNKYKDSGRPLSIRQELDIWPELERELSRIYSDTVLSRLKDWHTQLRPRIEGSLTRIAMEDVFSYWISPDAMVKYEVRTEGRNPKEMKGLKGLRKGFKTGYATVVESVQAHELASHWRDIVLSDKDITENPQRFLPEGATYMLATVQKFRATDPPNSNNGNGGNSYNLEVHFRVKSGPEYLWKFITLLTGLQERPDYVRDTIVDMAGVRLLAAHNFEKKAVDLHHRSDRMHRGIDTTDALTLQTLPMKSNGKVNQRDLFLSRLDPKIRSYYENHMQIEDRSYIDLNCDGSIQPYYLELLVPMGKRPNSIFDRNVVDILLYPLQVFKEMNERGYDQFKYKERDEGWRSEHYTLMEWVVGLRLLRALMDENGANYAEELIHMRMREAGYLPRGRKGYVQGDTGLMVLE